jgi:uroporphyrinogen-III synthase
MALSLKNKRILVTRPKGQAEELVSSLQALGAEPLVLPVITILPPEDWNHVDEAIHALPRFDWVVFTSVNGVRIFVERMSALGVPAATLAERKLAAIGPATANALARACRPPDVVPTQFLSDALPDALPCARGLRILLPRANIARKEMADELRRRGAEVVEVAVYQVKQETGIDTAAIVNMPTPDVITLTSPSAARSLAKMLEEAGRPDWLVQVPIICIGPITADAVRELGYQPARVAKEHTIQGLVQAILEEVNCHAHP